MPTTVQQLFEKSGIKPRHVKWGETPLENGQGVYVVSTSSNSNEHLGISEKPNFDDEQIKLWIERLPAFIVDNIRANSESVKSRLREFWLSDESILYIGKAPKRKKGGGVRNRVVEYYRTIIGNCSPHSGGQWIKTLKNLNTFTVYYGVCDNPSTIEKEMLRFFKNKNSESLIPFANIRFEGDKAHGFRNQRA